MPLGITATRIRKPLCRHQQQARHQGQDKHLSSQLNTTPYLTDAACIGLFP